MTDSKTKELIEILLKKRIAVIKVNNTIIDLRKHICSTDFYENDNPLDKPSILEYKKEVDSKWEDMYEKGELDINLQ